MDSGCWYVLVDGQPKGPFTTQEIQYCLLTGQRVLEDLVWCPRKGIWKKLKDFPLFSDLIHKVRPAQEPSKRTILHGKVYAQGTDCKSCLDPVNISSSGLLVRGDNRLYVGQVMDLVICSAAFFEPLRSRGVVVRYYYDEEAYSGFHFIDMSQKDSEKITFYTQKLDSTTSLP